MLDENSKKTLTKARKFDKLKFNSQVEVFIELDAISKELKRDKKQIDDALIVINEKLVKVYEKTETQSHKAKGRLVYLSSMIWAGRNDGVDVIDAVDGLKRARLFKKYGKEIVNMDKLHVEFRLSAENAKDGKAVIPDNLKDIFKATEKFLIKSKKG